MKNMKPVKTSVLVNLKSSLTSFVCTRQLSTAESGLLCCQRC